MIHEEKFDHDLLNKIKENKMAPLPRWKFILKNYGLWSLGALSLFLASLAMSLIVFLISHENWEIYLESRRHAGEIIFAMVPFFWLFCLGLAIALLYWEIKKTKKGYRYSARFIILLSVLASLLLGLLFYALGLGRKMDDILSRRAPLYEHIMNPGMRFWQDPGEGRLAGMVVSKTDDNNFMVRDMKRVDWHLQLGDRALIPGFELKVDEPALFVGQQNGDASFKAEKVMPLKSGREFFRRPPFKVAFPGNEIKKSPGDDLMFLLQKYPELKEVLVKELSSREILTQDPTASRLLLLLQASSSPIMK